MVYIFIYAPFLCIYYTYIRKRPRNNFSSMDFEPKSYTCFKKKTSQIWQLLPAVPHLQRLRQDHLELEYNLR